MSSAFTIEPATEADIPDILRLIKALALYEKAPESAKATPEQIQRHLFPKPEENNGQPYASCLVAKLGDKPGEGEAVGIALYFFNFSTWTGNPGLYLEDLYVLDAYRSFGIGKTFFRELAHVALEKGCVRMDWSVLDWNQPAIDFYEKKVGAKVMEEWRPVRLEGAEAIRGLTRMV